MKTKLVGWLGALALGFLPLGAQAAITCGVSSAGFWTGYTPAAPGTDITQTFITVTCTRGSAADPTTVNWYALASNGLYATGSNNRAARGAARINYDLYRDASCSSQWQGLAILSGTITFVGTGTVSATSPYWGCVPAGQGVAAGTYSDTVTVTMYYGGGFTSTTGAFGVSILTPATCAISTPPGSIVFNYTAFGAAIAPSTTYRVTCTSTLPYTMALDATSGTALGLNYTLALSAASATGTGGAQVFSILGGMAAGQSGTCASATCTATQVRSLTITY
jgi:spore coat protein U-like protein